ncbi:DUF2306 domain-containing protein [Nocardiopsis sp. RSe5-2]|uniref:DUF2306 domain-containing protein n=1 Tax=Nocardiopsis endophytica TaxID=3018445 RepID=A0ABT4U0D1_9ACTN|nr:DUF2306 domain-containing protein [Nocardiopsis endophytica]MDA2809959.1 DUF2306 domain-containing protein [Nocardiopsis endophytica]
MTATGRASRRTSRRTAWRIGLLFLVAVGAGIALVLPYLALDLDAGRTDPRNTVHAVLLRVHIFTALIALVLGPLQFAPAIRARRGLHRAIGRWYLFAGVLPSGVSGIPVALLADDPVTRVGLLIPSVGWLVTGGLALAAARRRDFAAHAAWMTRNYALTFLAVTSRVVVPLLLLAQLPLRDSVYGGSMEALIDASIPIGQWLGWIINLVIAEVLIRRRPRALRRSASTAESGHGRAPEASAD